MASGTSTTDEAMRGRRPSRERADDVAAPAGELPLTSRPGARDEAAEAALAPAEFKNGVLERGAIEIGPIDRHEDELAVGRLPHQEVRQALLAAGADDQIGIGHVGRIEIETKRLGSDGVGLNLPRRHVLGGPPRRARDLLPGAVVEGDDQNETVVVAGEVFGLLQQAANLRIEIDPLADDAHAHIVAMEFGQIVTNEA